MAAAMEDRVGDLVCLIQNYVFPRRIRVREFFLDYDKLRSGRVTQVQFGRALNTIGCRLSDDDIKLLTEHFQDISPSVQKPQDRNYEAFCRMVDKVFADRDIENQPDAQVASPGSTLRTSFTPQPVEDEEKLNHILHRLAALCDSRGVVLKYIFQDFERGLSVSPSNRNPRRAGKCTPNQFRRAFPFKKEFSEEDMNLLTHHFSTDKGDVAFKALHDCVSEVLQHSEQPFPQSPLIVRPDDTEWDHHSLHPQEKLQSKVVEKRVRLKEHFQDFDPLRKGFCTIGQAKTTFTILGIDKELDKSDFEGLWQKYAREDGMFRYLLFCEDTDSAFTTPGLEREPRRTVTMPDHNTTSPARRNKMSMTRLNRGRLAELEDKIRSKVMKQRMLLKPSFKDMDKRNIGHLTVSQFGRVMNSLGFELDQEEMNLLRSSYCDLGNKQEMNYESFCKTVDPPDDDVELAMKQLNAPYKDPSTSKYFDPLGKVVSPLDRMSPVCY